MGLGLTDNKRDFWQRTEATVVQIIELAIELMVKRVTLPKEENELNREFYFCLVEANFILQKKNMGLNFHPTYEALNQPSLTHLNKHVRENKRPDFQWSFADNSATSPAESAKQFSLECKRLDLKTASWDYVGQYFEGGIKRFISKEHGYGFNVKSSAMLAYVQSDDYNKYQSEINGILSKQGHPIMGSLINKFDHVQFSHTIQTEHSLMEIKLIHFWTELTKFYT